MKRLALLLVALVAVPATLLGGVAGRDILLTEDGVLYTIESVQRDDHHQLLLTADDGSDVETSWVPGSVGGGDHTAPSLAWDTDQQTLFVAWQRMPSMMSSEILLSTYRDGSWTDAIRVDNGSYRYRYNTRLAITRSVVELSGDETRKVRGMNLHLTWWEEGGQGDRARYAMITVRDGEVEAIQIRDLLDFIPADERGSRAILDESFDRELFRYPAVRSKSDSSVAITFADSGTDRFHTVDVTPRREQGVLEVPIGVRGQTFEPPAKFKRNSTSPIDIVAGDGRVAIHYLLDDGNVQYLLYRDGAWSERKTIRTDRNLSVDGAVHLIRSLIGDR